MSTKLFSLITMFVLAVPSIADAQCPVPGFKYAAFGDLEMDVTGGGQVRVYDSTVGTAPFTPVCNTDADLGTNSIAAAAIKVSGGSDVCGEVQFGAGGVSSTVVQITGAGSTIAGLGACNAAICSPQTVNTLLPSVILPSPALPSGGSVSGTLTLTPNQEYATVTGNSGDTITLNAGIYVINDLNMKNGSILQVGTGPVTVFVRTALDVSGTLTNTSQKATDLLFLGVDTLTTAKFTSAGTVTSFGIYAPKADITLTGSADFFGAFVGSKIKIAGGANLNYDKALANLGTTGLSCTEVSRASPIVATIDGSSCVVQGTFEFATVGGLTSINAVGDITNFIFPGIQGHMRARTQASLNTTATSFFDTTGVVFDAADGIPPKNDAGCSSGGVFNTSCRNVFTNTTPTTVPANGTTTFSGTPASRVTMFTTSPTNADLIGDLIHAGGVAIPGFLTAHKQAIIQKILAGGATGVAKLGGVDRSTVAVIGTSTVAGNPNRPTMAYFGGTDGMLHAVCASTGGTTASGSNICPGTLAGTELWAFMPRVQLPLIRTNKQRIDGSVRVVDVFGLFPDPTTGVTGTTRGFRTILTFQTGYAEGTKPAVYALDVTDPAKPILLWEYTTAGTLSTDGFDLGTGLAMHAGATIVTGAILNLAVAQTNNGGLYGSDCSPNRCGGMLATALKIETGERVWDYGFPYAVNLQSGPRNVTLDNYAALANGIPGGAVGVDLGGAGFTTDVVMGDLFGNLWRLDAATGKSALGTTGNTPTGGFRGTFSAANTLFGGSPIFSFTTNFHPIGALPAILDNGFKVAVFGTGAYVDQSANTTPLWTTAQQKLIGVKLTGTSTLTDGAAVDAALGQLTINQNLVSGEKVLGQVLVVGTEVFVATDTSDINSQLYGGTTTVTGNASGYDVATSTFTAVVSAGGLQGGASSLVNNGSNLYAGASNKTQQVNTSAVTTGTGVDYSTVLKASRLAWLDTKF